MLNIEHVYDFMGENWYFHDPPVIFFMNCLGIGRKVCLGTFDTIKSMFYSSVSFI